jgi:hypothetical protein
MDDEHQRLRDLSARLLRLHALLLEHERRAYEDVHGTITPRDLLQLLLGDERFAWLRSLSQMIARIDEALDTEKTGTPLDAKTFFRDAQRLLRSGGTDAFATRYAQALQDSPDVVMAHADVVKTLPRPQRDRH